MTCSAWSISFVGGARRGARVGGVDLARRDHRGDLHEARPAADGRCPVGRRSAGEGRAQGSRAQSPCRTLEGCTRDERGAAAARGRHAPLRGGPSLRRRCDARALDHRGKSRSEPPSAEQPDDRRGDLRHDAAAAPEVAALGRRRCGCRRARRSGDAADATGRSRPSGLRWRGSRGRADGADALGCCGDDFDRHASRGGRQPGPARAPDDPPRGDDSGARVGRARRRSSADERARAVHTERRARARRRPCPAATGRCARPGAVAERREASGRRSRLRRQEVAS